jgi:hypothetical protein
MDKLEIKQGSFIQQTQYFIPVGIDQYDRGLDLGFWEILKPLKWTNITSFFLIWLKRSSKMFISL